jgi:Ran GTPase-activating protein (RanGAP) involved in mRNA processing and transport
MKNTIRIMVEASERSAWMWGELRSVLESLKGEDLLKALQKLVDSWPDDQERDEAVIPHILRSRNFTSLIGTRWFLDSEKRKLIDEDTPPLSLFLATTLDLWKSGLRDEVVQKIVQSPLVQNIKELYLNDNKISDDGCVSIGESKYLNNTIVFNLADNNIGERGAVSLSKSQHLKSLSELSFSSNKIGDDGAIALINSPNLSSLRRLSISYSGLGDDTMLVLSTTPYKNKLKYLDLSNNNISDIGVRYLIEAEHLRALRMLDMRFTRASQEAIDELEKSPMFKKLTVLF